MMNPQETLTVMTYNIRSGRTLDSAPDLAGTARTMAAFAPDVAALNEVCESVPDCGGISQSGALADALQMHGTFARAIDYNGGQYGIALLTREAPRDAEIFTVPELPQHERAQYYEPRVVLSCVARLLGRDTHILVTHMGLNLGERRLAVETVLRALDKHKGMPTLFMGDLNDTPDASVFDPLYARLTDTFGRVNAPLTFPSGTPERRIDYIFYQGFRCLTACSPETTASDHRPIVARLASREPFGNR